MTILLIPHFSTGVAKSAYGDPDFSWCGGGGDAVDQHCHKMSMEVAIFSFITQQPGHSSMGRGRVIIQLNAEPWRLGWKYGGLQAVFMIMVENHSLG
jgi:hypothetical protein